MNIGLAYPVTYGLYAKFQAAPDSWQNKHIANVNGVVNMIDLDALSAPGLLESAVWKLVPGLADPNCFSIESKHYPGHYIHHKNFRAYVAANDGTPTFNQDATFMIRPQHAPGTLLPGTIAKIDFGAHVVLFICRRDSFRVVQLAGLLSSSLGLGNVDCQRKGCRKSVRDGLHRRYNFHPRLCR